MSSVPMPGGCSRGVVGTDWSSSSLSMAQKDQGWLASPLAVESGLLGSLGLQSSCVSWDFSRLALLSLSASFFAACAALLALSMSRLAFWASACRSRIFWLASISRIFLCFSTSILAATSLAFLASLFCVSAASALALASSRAFFLASSSAFLLALSALAS